MIPELSERRDSHQKNLPQDMAAFVKHEAKRIIAQLKEEKNPGIRKIYFRQLIDLKSADPDTFDKILKEKGTAALRKEFNTLSKTEDTFKTSFSGEMSSEKVKIEMPIEKLNPELKSYAAKTEQKGKDALVKDQIRESEDIELEEESESFGKLDEEKTERMELEQINYLKTLPPEALIKVIDHLKWTDNLLNILLTDKYLKSVIAKHPKYAFYLALRKFKEGKFDEIEPILKNMKATDIPPWKSDEIALFSNKLPIEKRLPIEQLFRLDEVEKLPPIYEKVLIDLMFMTGWDPALFHSAKNEKVKAIAEAIFLLGVNLINHPHDHHIHIEKIYDIDWKLFNDAPPNSRVLRCMSAIFDFPRFIEMQKQKPFSDDFLLFLAKNCPMVDDSYRSLLKDKLKDKKFILEVFKVFPDIYFIISKDLQTDPEIDALAAQHYFSEALNEQCNCNDVINNMRFQLNQAMLAEKDLVKQISIEALMNRVSLRFITDNSFKKSSKRPIDKRRVQNAFISELKRVGLEIQLKPVLPPPPPRIETVRIAKFDNRSPFQELVLNSLKVFINEFSRHEPINRQDRIFYVGENLQIILDPDKNKVSLINQRKQTPIDLRNEGREEETNKIVLTDEAAKPFLDHWRDSLKAKKEQKGKEKIA